ncbi:MAG: precorrin-2 C(20)-methyltransferase [Bacillota bacterium]
MAGKLYGLGVGPGDPELMTLKSKRILTEVDVVCTPQAKPNRDSLALEIISEVIDEELSVKQLHFPMTSDQGQLEAAWQQIVNQIVDILDLGRDVALITIGDPLFFSTYSYILEQIQEEYPQLAVETVPGITSVSASSSLLNLPLAQGDEKVAIIPTTDNLREVREALIDFENVVLMKVSKNFEELIELLTELELKEQTVFVSRCGQAEQFFTRDLDSLFDTEIDYLSLMIVKGGE